jgi:hypothetical protein
MQKFDDGIIQGYIDPVAKRLHFFGAYQIEDWLHVAQAWPCKWRGLFGVHRGFARLADRWLSSNDPADYRGWTISGHSMGGAIALLVGYVVKDCTVETAGCPRVALWTAWGLNKVKHSRYVNKQDLVPNLPPRLFMYRHFGTKVVYPSVTNSIKAHEPKEYQNNLKWCLYDHQID